MVPACITAGDDRRRMAPQMTPSPTIGNSTDESHRAHFRPDCAASALARRVRATDRPPALHPSSEAAGDPGSRRGHSRNNTILTSQRPASRKQAMSIVHRCRLFSRAVQSGGPPSGRKSGSSEITVVSRAANCEHSYSCRRVSAETLPQRKPS